MTNLQSHEWVSVLELRTVVSDQTIVDAIDKSSTSLPQFKEALKQCLSGHSDFLVTVFEKQGNQLFPVGIRVTKYTESQIFGLRIENDRTGSTGPQVSCKWEHVADWRYVDCFMLQGGSLYRAALSKLPPAVSRDIVDCAGFLLDLPKCVSIADYAFCKLLLSKDADSVRNSPHLNREKLLEDIDLPVEIDGSVTVQCLPLMRFACMYSNEDIVSFLLSYIRKQPPFLFHDSVLGSNVNVVRYMLERGQDVNEIDDVGRTALHYAARLRETRCLELLLMHSAKVDVRDPLGQTPLFLCTTPSAVKALLRAGADSSARNSHGESIVKKYELDERNHLCSLIDPTYHKSNGSIQKSEVALPKELAQAIADDRLGMLQALDRDFGYVVPLKSISAK